MRYLKTNIFNLITGLSFLGLTFSSSAQLISATSETLVNTTTTDSTQQNCAVAMDTLGRYVVVWESEGEDGDGFGIYAKIYNADHTVRVADFQINTNSDADVNDQRFPDVAMNAEGTFCVTWQSQEDEGWSDTWMEWRSQGWDVYRRIYDIDGNAVSSQSRVNSSTAGNQMHPAIAAGDDFFVVTYASEVTGENESEIYGRPFMSNGANVNSPQLIHSVTGSHMMHPDVAMTPTNEYTFTWQVDSLDGDRNGIYYASYDNSYNEIVAPTQVNTTTTGNQQEPRIAVDENGEFMIIWSSFDQDGDHHGIYGQRYSAPGTTSGGEISITTNTTGSQDHAALAVTREGGKYIISWTDDVADGDRTGVYSRSMFSNGSFLADDALINTTTSEYQNFSDVAIGNDTTQAVYAWQSGTRFGATSFTDPSYYGIYSQGFVVEDITPPVANCQNITVYLDGTGNVTITAADIDGGSTDNVGIVSMTAGTTAFDCADIGLNTSALTVYDAEGLSDGCVAAVIVEDTISPTAVCQNITVYLDGAGTAIWGANDIDGGSTDNCASVTLAADMTSATCADIGPNTVTLTVTDGSGNTSTCTSTVTVMDTVSPSAVCQNITVYLDGSGNATIVGADLDGGSTDNCAVTSLSADITSFTCAETGTNTVTLTAGDASGNTSTCVSTVTVLDTISPTAICQDITVYLGGSASVSLTAADVDGGSTDNCSVSLGIDVIGFTCTNTGTNTVVLTATDPSGNTNTCTSTVTVLDTISPTVVCQNITVYLDGTGNATITATDLDGGSTDNCSTVTLGADVTTFNCSVTGANTVNLTVTDGSGNTSSCAATVTVLDTVSPSAVCQDITVYLDGTGNATITGSDVDGGSTDNCAVTSTTVDVSAFDCSMTGANTVILTVGDASGNTNSCTATVTVADTTSPAVVCQDITVYLDGTGNATITSGDVDNGSTDNCGSPTMTIDVSSFDCSVTGANTVTLTATDASGNTSSCTATVTVADTISPTVVCQDITVYLDGTGNTAIAAANVDGGSTDNCLTPTMTIDVSSFDCSVTGTNTVTLTGTDASGNTSTCTATVTVTDTTSPSAVCQDITVYLDGTGNATITATDVDGGSTDNCGAPTMSVDISAFDCTMTGPNTVILTATDASGNTSTCTATVTVADTTSPAVVCQDITVYLDGTGNATIIAADVDAGSTDNCGTPTMSIDISAFNCTMTGPVLVALTATDASGNTSTCVATVTVADTTSPTVVCQDITVYLDGTGNATIAAADVDSGSSDNCATPTMTIDVSSFDCSATGTNTVTLTATDASGNTSTCTATVTVADTTSPTAVCQDVTVYLDPTGSTIITAADVDGGSTDNCGTPTMTIDVSSFDCSVTGPNTVILTATDASGNTSSCTATVTVADTTSPTVACQDITVYLDGTGSATITTADVNGGSTDNCGAPTMSIDVSSFDCSVTGANTVTLTGIDASGNTSSCIATVTVADTTSPMVVCQDINAYLDATGNVTIAASDVDGGSTDNCSTPILSINPSTFDCSTVGPYAVELTATDASGNTSICGATVTVMDTIAPTFANCPTDITLTPTLAGCSAIHIWTAPTESDNCSVTVVASHNSGDTFGPGVTTVTYTATDASGNTAVCSFDVTVVNDLAVNIVGTDALCFGDSTGTANAIGINGAGSPYTFVWSTGEVGPLENSLSAGVHTVTVTDAAGCVASGDVTIGEPLDIVLSTVVIDEMLGLDGEIDLTVTGGAPGYTFDWSNTEVTEDLNGLAGNVTYTVIVTDNNGCKDTLDVFVNSFVGISDINGDEAPTLVIFPNPTNDGKFSVQMNGAWTGEVTIEMVDSRGRLIYSEITSEEVLEVDLEHLEDGTYFIVARDEQDTVLTTRLVTVND
ncbi:MAG: HYR domain-containing protein [Crocinitomicaceae bacterium]|nr:HYR domain-containing protein [Crocinitomicaceae bacterium]